MIEKQFYRAVLRQADTVEQRQTPLTESEMKEYKHQSDESVKTHNTFGPITEDFNPTN